MSTDETFMREALREAARAEARGEVPVGSVVVFGGEIIARGHNLRETAQDPQIPSRHDRRNVSVGSISFLILISASRTIGPQLSRSTS